MVTPTDALAEQIPRFFAEALPPGWFAGAPSLEWDDQEILCVGVLAEAADTEAFREATRAERMAIARAAEAHFGRAVSWGVARGGTETLFTTRGAAVTSSLGLRERAVLDSLVDAGVARSRGDALAWCVRLVDRHRRPWLDELREALGGTETVRREGPVLL